MIEGGDFPGRIFDSPGERFGFFATRWREAENEEAAELAVVDALKEEYRATVMPLVDGEDTPTLHHAEIERLHVFPDEAPETGAAW